MLVIDIRLAGYIRNMSIMRTHDLLPMAAIGFFINMVTGLFFLMGDPARYLINIGFQIKMALILIAGLNALLFAKNSISVIISVSLIIKVGIHFNFVV